ncbi:MAG: divergent polysaccharide deacetylase family protein [Deferribacterota bacterium]|nr:divergent polysaccharide deacetylase family protein [Deferribacterota bacterium]
MAQKQRKRANRKKNDNKLAIFLTFILLAFLALSIFYIYSAIRKENEQFARDEVNEIDRNIRLTLFEHNLSEDNIIAYNLKEEGDKTLITYNISVNEDKYRLLKESLKKLLNSNNYNTGKAKGIKASKGNIIVAINFKIEGISPHKVKEKSVKEKEKVKVLGRIAIILDDGGYNIELIKRVARLPYPITVSILPFSPYDKESADLLRQAGKGVFLHLPLEPYGYPKIYPGKGAVLLNTPTGLIDVIINKDVERIGEIDGANNHMGSKFTENRDRVTLLLKSLSRYTDIFIDSRTSNKSVAYDVCRSVMQICGYNSLFIDNENNKSYVLDKLEKAYKIAVEKKKIIIIGHVRKHTVDALVEALPHYEKKGIKFMFVKDIL